MRDLPPRRPTTAHKLTHALRRWRAVTSDALELRRLFLVERERERSLQHRAPRRPRRGIAKPSTEQVGISQCVVDVDNHLMPASQK